MRVANSGKLLFQKSWPAVDQSALMMLNDWLTGIQYRAKLFAEEDVDPGEVWQQIINENSDESRERVRTIIRLFGEGKNVELNELLSKYSYQPYASFEKKGEDQVPTCDFYPPSEDEIRPELKINQYPSGEVQAVLMIVKLVSAGRLNNLTTCPVCTDLFLPRVGQTTCGAECSKKAYSQTPSARKRRRDTARKNYDSQFPTPKRSRKPREQKNSTQASSRTGLSKT